MRCIGLLLFTYLIAFGASAQLKKRYYEEHAFDISTGVGNRNFSVAVAWNHLHGIGKGDQRLQVGYGLRFTNYIGANKYFTTAPSKYTSTKQNIATIFSETIDRNIDTISTATASVYSLNLALYIQYKILKRFDVGANIDVIGVSFGPDKTFNVISSDYDPGQSPIQHAGPTHLNLLLTSDNDIGSLNSEFFVRFALSNRWAIRAGYAFVFAEYRTETELSFDNGRITNDRYRNKAGMAMLSLGFKPFAKH